MFDEMIFGSQYYRPPFPIQEVWERDLKKMKQYGFNTIKLWAVWNWIEKEEGKFDFKELDNLIFLAEQQGLKTIINLIPEGAPYWAYSKNQNALYMTHRGEKIEFGGPANIPSAGWPGFCWDSADARRLMERFFEKSARHFAGNKSVIAIDVWNEPHLEPMFDYKSEILCYCSHSCEEFRVWLKARYLNIDALNTAWCRQYLSWDEVTPPPRFGTWTDMIDWRLFWIDNLRRWLKVRVDATRRGAPDKIIQTHVAYSGVLGNKMEGGLCNELGDEFALVNEVDVFGLSSFPKWLQGEDHYYVHLAHNEMIAEASLDTPFYQVELQGGAGKPGLLGGEVPNEHDILVWNYNTIIAGGKGVLYWQYSPEPAGLESPGFGLTGFQGEDTPRSLMASRCAKKLNTKALTQARRVKSVNAIYVSRHSQALCYSSERRESSYSGSISGIYKALYNSGIPVRFFHEDRIDTLLEEGIRTLYLPMTLVLSEHEINQLVKYVESGGILIGEAGTGIYDRNGKIDFSAEALSRLFGLSHVEIEAAPSWGEVVVSANSGSNKFKGIQYRHLVKPICKNTKIIAEYNDKYPAMTSLKMGQGESIFISTFPSLSYQEEQDRETMEILTQFFKTSGYEQFQLLRTEGPNIAVRLLETDTEYLIGVVNHGADKKVVKVKFSLNLVREDNVDIPVSGYSGEIFPIPKACI